MGNKLQFVCPIYPSNITNQNYFRRRLKDAGLPFAGLLAFWCVFCGALAVRGPASFSEALALPPSQIGRGSALMVLALLLAGALGTQAVAPFLAGPSPWPLAVAMLAMTSLALALVVPWPARPTP